MTLSCGIEQAPLGIKDATFAKAKFSHTLAEDIKLLWMDE